MIATTVHIKVKPEYIEEFIEASRLNHEGSRQEAGNVRFDILQHRDDPSCFTFYEVFRTEADIEAHKGTEHYKRWRETVEPWMAEPRRGVAHKVLFPLDSSEWGI